MASQTLTFTNSHIKHSGAQTDQISRDPSTLKDFSIKVTNKENSKISKEKFLSFEVTGIDPALAILLRRSINNDIQTVAIERVGVYHNNSLLSDEILVHRLGLIPIDVDPKKLQPFKGEMNLKNTIIFKLEIECTEKEGVSNEERKLLPKSQRWKNSIVYSKDLRWVPQGDQLAAFGSKGPKCLYDDIVIAKLRPGQSIALEAFCQLGVGIDHAKFAAVSTATFRLKPKVSILRPIEGEKAKAMVASCPEGLFGVKGEKQRLFVKDAGKCSFSRESIRLAEEEGEKEVSPSVLLEALKGHYLFDIESHGVIDPNDCVIEAMEVVRRKCKEFLENLAELKKE